MPYLFLVFALGAIGASLNSVRIPSECLFAAVLLIAAAWGFLRWPMLALLCSLTSGFALGTWQVHQRVDAQLSPVFDGRDYSIEFVIDAIPSVSGHSSIFTARVIKLECTGECPNLQGLRVRLGWYQQTPELYAGDIWQATVRLKRPRGFVNPGGFDYQAWLLAQELVATGYVRGNAQRVGRTNNLARVRHALKQRVLENVNLNNSGFFSALLVGDKSDLQPKDWGVLQSTGTIHLMAISGLHIGLMAFLGLMVGRFIVKCLAIICPLNVYGGHALPLFTALVFALGYAALAGFSLPTLRAASACFVLSLAALCGVKLAPWTWYLWVLCVVVIFEPFAAYSAGFWLSFGAVAVLIYCFYGRRAGWFKALCMTQLVLALGLSAPLLFAGQALSVSSPIANFIAVPVVSFIVVPGLMVAACLSFVSTGVSAFLLAGVDWVFQGLWWCLGLLDSPMFSAWFDRPLSALASIVLLLACVLLLSPRGLSLRTPGVFLLGVLVFAYQPKQSELQVTVMDVGQGLAVVIKTPQETWLYDTGPAFSDDFDAGSRIILPYLRQQGVQDLSLIVSHADLDHSGGVDGLASQMPIKRLVLGEALPGKNFEYCKRGDRWLSGNLAFEVLWPDKPGIYEGNNASCVVLLTLSLGSTQRRILLTGDIDKSVERKLLADIHQPLDLLVASHHGSNSSSAWSFIRRGAPKFVVFSAGFKNRYRHPSEKVVRRFEELGTHIFNTATDGAVIFTWTKQGNFRAQGHRNEAFRLWYDR